MQNLAIGMHIVHGAGQDFNQPGRRHGCQGRSVKLPRQIDPRHQLHREPGQAIVFAKFIDLNDVRVMEPYHVLGFPTQTFEQIVLSFRPTQNCLECYYPVQAELADLVDAAHTADAQFTENLIRWDRRPTSTRRQ
jgi:hypothetical protein